MRKQFILASLVTICLIGLWGVVWTPAFWLYVLVGPPILLGTVDMFDRKHTIIMNYPIFGRFRYVMEELRPKIYQYFIESDTDGTPINRLSRSLVYQRAKKDLDSTPFGTQINVYEPGYEWINHSIYPSNKNIPIEDLKVKIGGKDCKQPYNLSIFNISAMSFGALSKNAIEALNWGAKLGGFAHNTGEGGVSPYHLKHGGDLIWQIGTGYFGCRDIYGNFSDSEFANTASNPQIKMIEIKISQGAKPGHGGILPAGKNTPEIAKIRGLKPHTTVFSPPNHSTFKNPHGLIDFIKKLRQLSEGKPVGFKLCVGSPQELEDICNAMLEKNIFPDFITIDGGEGGTGAAPQEFSNSIGMPLRDGLIVAANLLVQYGLKEKIPLICSGKILSGFDIVKCMALGASACYSARGMMLAIGCIQALLCNKNSCPTGVATQDPALYKGLVVAEKYKRVANFHHATLESVSEILSAAGIKSCTEVNRKHIWRRISVNDVKTYEELFPLPEQIKTSKAA